MLTLVSIPTRCDQNSRNAAISPSLCRFQFRHGAIKTLHWSFPIPDVKSVSIPTRCDQNVYFDNAVYFYVMFQFRHGAIKTKEGYLATVTFIKFQFRHGAIKTSIELVEWNDRTVSIPTRCDQNCGYTLCSNLIVGVSIPTRCDQNKLLSGALPTHRKVSIPTRCDQNV